MNTVTSVYIITSGTSIFFSCFFVCLFLLSTFFFHFQPNFTINCLSKPYGLIWKISLVFSPFLKGRWCCELIFHRSLGEKSSGFRSLLSNSVLMTGCVLMGLGSLCNAKKRMNYLIQIRKNTPLTRAVSGKHEISEERSNDTE